ncbi:hypothetical protein VCHA54P500_10198 [Vibrio chagasii]|nr:hypothetical protein VCHA34P117_10182 [Vibrio chagasii]CAH7022678.1 hypothetical protein VCHA48P439_10198 [Vibrio chagasii]CAH7031658.1 hypothetical protein VCHA40O236_10182 [Vibrio chagasii]CAH7087281.1 hypothetical protein VCHA54P500_10198 [Vibrio chagasii]CAH7272850.1 hypothetical protein VCHA53O462_10198 [Vibrio chagasii]
MQLYCFHYDEVLQLAHSKPHLLPQYEYLELAQLLLTPLVETSKLTPFEYLIHFHHQLHFPTSLH